MCCPHYLEESDRKPTVHKMLQDGKAMKGYGIDGGSAVHFINEKFERSISFYPERKAYFIEKDNSIKEKELPHIVL